MQRTLGLSAIAALLWLIPAPPARAQIGFGYGFPGYQSYNSVSYGFGLPYGYGGYGLSGGLGLGGGSVYNSGYSSAYVAPGTSYFSTGSYGLPYGYGGYAVPTYGVTSYGVGPFGYGVGSYGIGAPAIGYGYGGFGRPYGYGGLGRSGYVATGPFMGLPRPFAGLVRVPR